jgi:HEAT repeat protein
VNKQVKAALSAVRDFISGHSSEPKVPDADDQALRKVLAAELLTSISRANEPSRQLEAGEGEATENTQGEAEQLKLEQERSRQLFMEHGYFDEAVQNLRTGNSAADRAAAARTLGLVGSQRATADLIAAMFDRDAEVRQAADEALTQIGDPTVTKAPITEMPITETATESQIAEASIHDIEASLPGTDEIPTTEVNEDVAETLPAPTGLAGEAEPDTLVPQVLQVETVQPSIVDEAEAATEEEQLLLEEHAVRETVEQYERQLIESAAMRQKAENEARWRAEREAKIRVEAEARRVDEETRRKQAEAEAARRRSVEAEALAAEHDAREQAEAEVHRLAEEEARLRLETGNLRHAAEELARQRRQIEIARREAAEAARHAEATRARQEAEKIHQTEVERLQNEEQALRFAIEETMKRRSELETSRQKAEAEITSLSEERNQLIAAAEAETKQLQEERERLFEGETTRRAEAERLRREAAERKRAEEEQLQQQLDALSNATNEIAARRAEKEIARAKAEQDAEQLAEALVRMRAADEARARAEQERLQVEAATKQQLETEQRLLEEARRRALEEQARLEEERRRHNEAEEQRIAALEVAHRKAEFEEKQRAEKEKQIHSEIAHIRIADAEARRRIEDAESLRRASEQAYQRAAEKVQRMEAEAHAATQQEELMLTKLETARRNLANEAQARAAQEKRVKEEIEQFHRLQDEERPRLEAAILQRTAAAARLQQMKEHSAEVAAQTEEEFQTATVFASDSAAGDAGQTETIAEVSMATSPAEAPGIVPGDVETSDRELASLEERVVSGVQPAVGAYLNSVDPYKRAAAVWELARSQGKEAFPMIANCFDDHSVHVRNAAARALCQLEPARTIDFFNRALDEGSDERRRNIGSAIASSGLAKESINNLASESREATYNALSILFVMAKTGETEPLVHAIEEHGNDEVRKAVVKLLTLSGQAEIADAAMKRREDAQAQ